MRNRDTNLVRNECSVGLGHCSCHSRAILSLLVVPTYSERPENQLQSGISNGATLRSHIINQDWDHVRCTELPSQLSQFTPMTSPAESILLLYPTSSPLACSLVLRQCSPDTLIYVSCDCSSNTLGLISSRNILSGAVCSHHRPDSRKHIRLQEDRVGFGAT